ncbi:MAG: hypothetical protein WBN29_00185 [Polyangiales bacterium]|jgi:hypothetical protein
MSAIVLLWAGLAIAMLLSSGYLFGVYSSRVARQSLRTALSNAEAHNAALKAQVVDDQNAIRELASQLERARSMLAGRAPLADRSGERMEEIASRVKAEIAPLLQGAQRSEQLHADLKRQLQPLLERDQATSALANLDPAIAESGDLPNALTLIADAGGFGTVVLSDNVGLPMANNKGGKDVEVHAGLSSLLLTMVDRVKGNELPAPIAAVFRDQANQVVVHRVFTVDSERYVLTAVATGKSMAPDILDPTLKTVERIIDRARW